MSVELNVNRLSRVETPILLFGVPIHRSLGSSFYRGTLFGTERSLRRSYTVLKWLDLKHFAEMQAVIETPDLCTYSIMLDGFFKNRLVAEAVQLFKSIYSEHVMLNNKIFNVVLNGLCRAGNLEAAKGLMLDVVSFNILIQGLCKNGDLLETHKMLLKMKNEGIFPNSVTFSIIVQGLLGEKEVKRAMELLDEMAKLEFLPNTMTVSMLVKLSFGSEDCNEFINLLPNFSSKCKGENVDVDLESIMQLLECPG